MSGIVSFGAYVPSTRLPLALAQGRKPKEGGPERSVAYYDEDAITGDNASETKLATSPTNGDWSMSLPCPEEDLTWVQAALAKRSKRVTARKLGEKLDTDADEGAGKMGQGREVTGRTDRAFRGNLRQEVEVEEFVQAVDQLPAYAGEAARQA